MGERLDIIGFPRERRTQVNHRRRLESLKSLKPMKAVHSQLSATAHLSNANNFWFNFLKGLTNSLKTQFLSKLEVFSK